MALPPVMEPLEARRVLSVLLSGGVLTVVGTAGNDAITISLSGRHLVYGVTVNGSASMFASSAVRAISIDAGNGNDWVALDPAITVNATLVGGNGNDTLIGGGGHELIEGGSGNNVLYSGPGDNLLYGGDGSSTLYGGAGNDTLVGSAATDFPWFKGQGQPHFRTGNNLLVAGSGNNWLIGGFNSDTLHVQTPGRDTLIAGSGHDILDGRGNDLILKRKPGDIVPIEDHHAPAKPGQDFAIHIHAHLFIFIRINGKYQQMEIPQGVGDFSQTPVFHTHDDSGTLHMHDLVKRNFTLGEFFRNWGVSLSATNIGPYVADAKHPLVMYVKHDGQAQYHRVDSFGNYVIQGNPDPRFGDKIIIQYG